MPSSSLNTLTTSDSTIVPKSAAGEKAMQPSPAPETTGIDDADLRDLEETLYETFGFTELRPGQLRVVENVLKGKDTLVVMPTGGGKSLCYQLPALRMPGTTVVVSPLISLMKDQVEKLREAGVSAAELNSTLSAREAAAILEQIADAESDFVFTTPERLSDPDFIATLRQTEIDLFVIDEAHCISQWGHDFRPAFLQLSTAIAALGNPPVLALTATATDDVIADIRKQLDRPRMQVINTGIFRANLHYSVIATTEESDKLAHVIRLARETPGSGIVYAATIKTTEEIHLALREAGVDAVCYHGQMSAKDRDSNQDSFMSGESRLMVATNAFGMGIDKPDIRFVIHHQIPANLEAYYQESGRAGRDGEPAECILLYYLKDKRLQQFFLSRRHPAADDLADIYTELQNIVKKNGKLPLAAIKEKLNEVSANKILVALKLLKDGRLIRQDKQLRYSLTSEEPTPATFESLIESYREKNERDNQGLEQMVFYAQTGFCRWRVLLDYFGDQTSASATSTSADFEQCGTCDNCLHPPELALSPVVSIDAKADDVPKPESLLPQPGVRVRVAKYGEGEVVSTEDNKVTILFPDAQTKTFLRDFVELL